MATKGFLGLMGGSPKILIIAIRNIILILMIHINMIGNGLKMVGRRHEDRLTILIWEG